MGPDAQGEVAGPRVDSGATATAQPVALRVGCSQLSWWAAISRRPDPGRAPPAHRTLRSRGEVRSPGAGCLVRSSDGSQSGGTFRRHVRERLRSARAERLIGPRLEAAPTRAEPAPRAWRRVPRSRQPGRFAATCRTRPVHGADTAKRRRRRVLPRTSGKSEGSARRDPVPNAETAGGHGSVHDGRSRARSSDLGSGRRLPGSSARIGRASGSSGRRLPAIGAAPDRRT